MWKTMYYINKMLTDLHFLIDHTYNLTKEDIEQNEVLLDGIMFRLIQISENSNKLTETFKKKHSEISWVSIKGMRNRLVHDYGEVDYSIVIDTILQDVPDLYDTLKEINWKKWKTWRVHNKKIVAFDSYIVHSNLLMIED